MAEQTPLSALRVGELALEAGLPAGVLNIIQGSGGVTGAALSKHKGVNKVRHPAVLTRCCERAYSLHVKNTMPGKADGKGRGASSDNDCQGCSECNGMYLTGGLHVQLAFTGSTEIGKIIMKQAAEHIVPGEKSYDSEAFTQSCCTSRTAGIVQHCLVPDVCDQDFYCTQVQSLTISLMQSRWSWEANLHSSSAQMQTLMPQ